MKLQKAAIGAKRTHHCAAPQDNVKNRRSEFPPYFLMHTNRSPRGDSISSLTFSFQSAPHLFILR